MLIYAENYSEKSSREYMKVIFRALALGGVLLVWLYSPVRAACQGWQSEIVYEGDDGKLVYVADQERNRIPDFSHAGYRGGGVSLPEYPVVRRISPVEGDNTAHLQAAIDAVSALAPDAQGIRGALLLDAGVYTVSEQLQLRTSGIVLRGAGQNADSTGNSIIRRIGTKTESVIRVGSGGNDDASKEIPGTRTNITSSFVQVGAKDFTVETPSLIVPGDQVVITHPITDAWLAAVDGGGTASDPPWTPDEFDIAYTRTVVGIEDSLVSIEAPVFNHLDRSLSQSFVYKPDRIGEIEEVGIEDLRIVIETEGPLSENHAESAIEFVHVANGWVQRVSAVHFLYAGVDIRRSMHVTVRDSEALEPHSLIEGGRRYNFAVYRSQLVLFENNLATGGRHNYVGNGEAWDSGIVFLNNISQDAHTSSEPHRHWGQAFLYDNHIETGSSLRQLRLRLGNRGDFGTGHGWSAVHSVAWNCKMNRTTVAVEKPPTAQNYAIGCEGNISGSAGSFQQPGGYIEGANVPGLYPSSLYLKQLADRLGLPFGVGREAPEANTAPVTIHGYPNPFGDRTTLQVHLDTPAHVLVEVFDILGRRVAMLADHSFVAGGHKFTFAAGRSKNGVYLARITVSQGTQLRLFTRKLIQIR